MGKLSPTSNWTKPWFLLTACFVIWTKKSAESIGTTAKIKRFPMCTQELYTFRTGKRTSPRQRISSTRRLVKLLKQFFSKTWRTTAVFIVFRRIHVTAPGKDRVSYNLLFSCLVMFLLFLVTFRDLDMMRVIKESIIRWFNKVMKHKTRYIIIL